MGHSFKSFLTISLYLILLAIPIIALFSKDVVVDVGSGPAVVLRAFATFIMLLLLIPQKGYFATSRNAIARHTLFLFFYVITITLLFNPSTQMAYAMMKVLYPLLGFLCFYYLTKNRILNDKLFSAFFLLLIVIIAITTYFNLSTRMDSARGLTTADNTGYALVCTYAGIMLLSNKKIFPVILFLVIVGTLIAGKRGAIIAMIVATLPILKYIFSSHQVKLGRRIIFIILIAVGCYLAIRYFSTYFDAAFGRFEHLEEDNGSGRSRVYRLYFDHFMYSSNLINQIFGHGLYAGAWASGSKYAFIHVVVHNDWLELLFDFGVIGALIYSFIFIQLLLLIIRHRKNKSSYYYMLVMSFIIWFVKSIFSSTFLMDVNSIYLYMTTAYSIAKLEQEGQSIKLENIIQTNDHQKTTS